MQSFSNKKDIVEKILAMPKASLLLQNPFYLSLATYNLSKGD